MNRLVYLFPVLLACTSAPVDGQVRWSADFNFGLPVNVPAPLTIARSGHPDIRLRAEWSAESFIRPYNWMWRVSRWNNGKAWEFETLHHKMILVNRPDNVQWLSISHGFNTLSVNRAFGQGPWILRAGAGCVLAHPESTIDGIPYDMSGWFHLGYCLTGPVGMLAAARPIRIGPVFRINLEAKLTAGYASVPVADGRARLMHLAFHLEAGPAFSVRGRSPDPPSKGSPPLP